MGELSSLAKATMELEQMYLGIPDDSVNLTFQDLVDMKQNPKPSASSNQKKLKSNSMVDKNPHGSGGGGSSHAASPIMGVTHGHGLESERSVAYDDVSVISMASTFRSGKGQRHRPGIPHSNICTICTTYTYIFRRRCLVCGRVYCKQCTYMGMGEMKEGRKCVLCLGRRFSHRYIKHAGETGCCWRYPSTVKQAELNWAEKGPRRRGERAYGHGHSGIGIGNDMMSSSRSPIGNISTTPPSFVATTPARAYSPYTPTHHHIPL